MTTNERIKEIKQSFRQMMDGSIAQSMRNKGVDYKLNWGATLPRLRAMADEILKSQQLTVDSQYELAIALWKENVRECKILATMLMPAERMLPEVCDIWMEQMPSQEMAYQWIASDKEYYQLCGFHTLTRIFMNGQEPNERGINEFLDQALAALQGPSLAVRKAAMQSLQRFADLGLVYERMAKSVTKSINLDFF